MDLKKITLQLVQPSEEKKFQSLMKLHHYLGALPKIGRTLWYAALYENEWVALIGFSAAAWKCAARDQWIGWRFRYQYDRLHLIANNSRFLILPEHHYPNLASRILSLCERRISLDWQKHFGHPLLLLETFVDPQYFHGTIYRAANWVHIGDTRGFRRTSKGYSSAHKFPKQIFVRSLTPRSQTRLSQSILDPYYCHGAPKIMLTADQMRTLPAFFLIFPIPAASRDNDILYPAFWLFQPVQCFVEWRDIRPSVNGLMIWAKKRVNVSVVENARGIILSRAVRRLEKL